MGFHFATFYSVGIRVQLEAQCSLKFETKLDNRVSFHKKYDNILPGAGEIDMSDTFQESPIMTDVVRILGWRKSSSEQLKRT